MRTQRRKLRREAQVPTEAGFPDIGNLHYLRFLEAIHPALKPRAYLEIGTESGASLAFAQCLSVAVDPMFKLQGDVSRNKPELHQFQGTSDDFFASNLLGRLGIELDLAFLDGMHLFEFLLRDFMNTEMFMATEGTVLLHDCVPFNQVMAEREWDKAKTVSWTGDVWKVVAILREYRPDLDVRVLRLSPTGLVQIRNLDPKNHVLQDNYDEILERWTTIGLQDYGLQKFCDLMDLQDVSLENLAPTDRPAALAPVAPKSNGTIAIKCCAPDADQKELWGDWHFAQSLAKALELQGHQTRVDILPEWAAAPENDALDIVIQGHDHHPPRPGIPCLMWLIYPGKRFDQARLQDYDHVFVASELYARKLARRMPGLSLSVLQQAFDPAIVPANQDRGRDLIFVGNNHFGANGRPIVNMARANGAPLKVWGGGWDDLQAGTLVAPRLANHDLGTVYASARAVLCDHTTPMARNGFASNRLFDALACGAPIISDYVAEMPLDLAGMVKMVGSAEQFAAALAQIDAEDESAQATRRAFAAGMADRHSFAARAKEILRKAQELKPEILVGRRGLG